jgi:uncharacterized protein YdeI (YjbR/CyaY-like superfamily)
MQKSSNSPLGRYYPPSRVEWRKWLEENHATSPGIWLIYFKKGINKPTLSYDDAVEEALSFGWIDSTVNKLDGERYLQLFTPRKPTSTWSRLNKQRVKKLIKNGSMTVAGLEKIEAAKKNGSWTILDDVEDLIVPPGLEEAFKKNKKARDNYNAFTDSVKKQVLWFVISAKRPETRQNRIDKVIKATKKNEKPF